MEPYTDVHIYFCSISDFWDSHGHGNTSHHTLLTLHLQDCFLDTLLALLVLLTNTTEKLCLNYPPKIIKDTKQAALITDTFIWRHTLMSTSIAAALLIFGTVTVKGTHLITHSYSKVFAWTHSWLFCKTNLITKRLAE